MFGENGEGCGLSKEDFMKMFAERLGGIFSKKDDEYEMHSALSEDFLREHKTIELEYGIAKNKIKELDARANLLWARIMDSVKIYDKDLRIEGEFLMVRKDAKSDK